MGKTPQIKRKRGQHGPIRHGGFSFLTTGEVPKKRSYVRRYLQDVRDGIINDLGGRTR